MCFFIVYSINYQIHYCLLQVLINSFAFIHKFYHKTSHHILFGVYKIYYQKMSQEVNTNNRQIEQLLATVVSDDEAS